MKSLKQEDVDSFLKNLRRGDEVEVNILEAGPFSHATVGAHRGIVDWKYTSRGDFFNATIREVSIVCETGQEDPDGKTRISIFSWSKVAYLGKNTKAGTHVEAAIRPYQG